jgi:predicted nucleic acid-binding Zn ribbon protein
VRRQAPRGLDRALEELGRELAPATPLAAVQACWETVVGRVIAREARPVSERGGTLTVECSSATWAQEIELLAPDLVERLNAAIGPAAGGRVSALRPRTGRSS